MLTEIGTRINNMEKKQSYKNDKQILSDNNRLIWKKKTYKSKGKYNQSKEFNGKFKQ